MRFVLVVLLLTACGGSPEPKAPVAAAAAPTPECLAKVDKADGTEDHVGHKCPNCGLGMEGAADQVSTVGGYQVHSCSASCKSVLDANPGAVLAKVCK